MDNKEQHKYDGTNCLINNHMATMKGHIVTEMISNTSSVNQSKNDSTDLNESVRLMSSIERTQAVIEFDLSGTILRANEAFCNAVGYTENEIVGQHHRIFVDSEYAKTDDYRRFWEDLGRGAPQSGEFERKRRDGSSLWLMAAYSPVMDDSGKPYKVVKVGMDITEAKTGLLAAMAESDKVNNMMRQMPINVMLCDKDLVLTYMNETCYNTLSKLEGQLPVKTDDLIGTCIDVFHKDPSHQRKLLADPKKYLPYLSEIVIGGEDVRLQADGVYDADGEFIGCMATWTVITDQKKLERENEEAQQRERESAEDLEKKVNMLLETAETVGSGNLDVAVPFESEDAIGNLAKGIGKMITSMRESKEAEDAQRKDIENKVDMLLKCTVAAGEGDLTVKVPFSGDDPLGLLAQGTEDMLGNMMEAMSSIMTGVDEIDQGAQQISSASQSLSGAASEQAANLEEISASIEEMSSMTQQNADNCTQAASLSAQSLEAASRGETEMGAMNTAVDDIMQSSNEISKIIKVIDEIAFQTNLLALNAAVEAARAGEAGKGFAVVAEEVRNLARRSAEAAKNTSSMIEESTKRAENGAAIAKRVGEVLGEIVDGTKQVNSLLDDIANASKEQTDGVTQINRGVSELDTVTQQNAGNSEELAATAEETAAQVATFRDIVNKFTIEDSSSSQQKSQGTQSSKNGIRSAQKPSNDQNAENVIPFQQDAFANF